MKISIITPAHNEEQVIQSCIESVRNLIIPEGFEVEHIIVADRCKDRTIEICKDLGVQVIAKDYSEGAIDPVTETFQLGVVETDGEIIGKVDADIILQPNWLLLMIRHLDQNTVSVSSKVKTRTGRWWLDFLLLLRDINYRIAPLGEDPRGAARLINRDLLKEITGFDLKWASWDTCLDRTIRMRGFRTLFIKKVTVFECRRSLTIRRIIQKQIAQGKARKRLGVGSLRTFAHSFFRVRPFVFIGYLKGNLDV